MGLSAQSKARLSTTKSVSCRYCPFAVRGIANFIEPANVSDFL